MGKLYKGGFFNIFIQLQGGKSVMEENDTNKPQQGTYDEMTPSSERKPKVEFDIGKSNAVQFSKDFKKPRELPSSEKNGGVYYIFECVEEGEDKIFMTAAWSLMQGLKNHEPLAGKNLLISKELVKGKQHYSVEEITEDKEEEVPVEKPGKGDEDDDEEGEEDSGDDEVEDSEDDDEEDKEK